jgi:hypothetical protein
VALFGRKIRRSGAVTVMLSKPLRFSFPIVGKMPRGMAESSLRGFTYFSDLET